MPARVLIVEKKVATKRGWLSKSGGLRRQDHLTEVLGGGFGRKMVGPPIYFPTQKVRPADNVA